MLRFHNELFPDVHDVPDEALRELTDILTHAIGGKSVIQLYLRTASRTHEADSLTSQSPTVPYSLDVLKDMLALVKDIRGMLHAYFFLCPYTEFFEQNRMALHLALLVSSVSFQVGFVYFLSLRIFRSSSWHFLYVDPVRPST